MLRKKFNVVDTKVVGQKMREILLLKQGQFGIAKFFQLRRIEIAAKGPGVAGEPSCRLIFGSASGDRNEGGGLDESSAIDCHLLFSESHIGSWRFGVEGIAFEIQFLEAHLGSVVAANGFGFYEPEETGSGVFFS